MIRLGLLAVLLALLIRTVVVDAAAPAAVTVTAAPGTGWTYSVNGVEWPPMIPGQTIYLSGGDTLHIATSRLDGHPGDANGDGKLGLEDCAYILRVLNGI